jgi:hypothetical protein
MAYLRRPDKGGEGEARGTSVCCNRRKRLRCIGDTGASSDHRAWRPTVGRASGRSTMEDEIYDSSMLSRHKLTYRRIFTIFLQAT